MYMYNIYRDTYKYNIYMYNDAHLYVYILYIYTYR